MNVYELAAKIFLKNLDVKYVTDDKRKHVAGLAVDAIDAAEIFTKAAMQHEADAKGLKLALVNQKEQQLKLPFPEGEL